MRLAQKVIILVLTIIWAVPVMNHSALAASHIPAFINAMDVGQLRGYLQSMVGDTNSVSTKSTATPRYTVSDLVDWGKQALWSKSPIKALVFFDSALSNDPRNQKANFWRAIAVLGSNPDIIKELQSRNILDSHYEFIPGAVFSLPDVIFFNKYQGLTAGMVNEIKEARNNLKLVNVTFGDDITNEKLGTVHLDYAAAQMLGMVLNIMEMDVHLLNSYATNSAQLTKNDLGMLTKDNLKSITSNVDGLYSDLIKYNYIAPNGTVLSRYKDATDNITVQAAFVANDSTPKKYYVYTWLGTYNSRVALAQGDSCNPGTVRTSGSNIQTAYNSSIDYINSWCKSELVQPLQGGNGYFDSVNISVTHSGVTYQRQLPYAWYITTDAINSYYPVDPILSNPKRADIFKILDQLTHKTTILDLLKFYPQLLASKRETSTELNAAKTALVGVVDSYMAMSDYLHSRDDAQGVNYAISLYQSPQGKTVDLQKYEDQRIKHTDDEAAIRQFLTDIKKNVQDPAHKPYVTLPQGALFESDIFNGWKINLGAFFSPKVDRRSQITVINTLLAKYKILPTNFFDPSLGGVFPLAKAEDINFLLKKGAGIGWAAVSNNQSSIVLNWTPTIAIKGFQYIKNFQLYRGLTPQVDRNSGVLVATLGANSNSYSPNSYTDATIDPNVSVYYYRLYTNFKFDDGTLAVAYSKPFKLTLHAPAANHPPILFQIADQNVVEGKSLTVSVMAIDPDNNPLRLTARLANGAAISSIGATMSGVTMAGNLAKATFVWKKAQYINGGNVAIVVTADDAHGGLTSATVAISVKKAK